MLDIPSDIWLHIAQFIPECALHKMLGVNSVFFNLGMNARYGRICVDTTSARMMWILSRLRDPAVARRVRHLHVKRYFKESAPLEKLSRTIPKPRKLTALLHLPRRVRGRPRATPITSPPTSTEFGDVLSSLIEVLPFLTQVNELSIDWWYLPMYYDIHPFLRAAWGILGTRLRKLTLRGNVESYTAFLSTSDPLPDNFKILQDLDIEFIKYTFIEDQGADSIILLKEVAPFINRLGPQLRSLKLTSWATLDLSSFVKRLGPFPLLRHFYVHVPFGSSFKRDPSGLTRILRDHSDSLQHVELKLDQAGFMGPTNEQTLSGWMERVANSLDCVDIFSNLQTLAIHPTTLPAGFNALVTFINRSSMTLVNLSVMDRHLSYEEVTAIISALPVSRGNERTHLRHLSLCIRMLTPRLFGLLAIALPGLERLVLDIDKLGEDTDFGNGNSVGPHISKIFCANMQGRVFEGWKLHDLSILRGSAKLDGDVMRTIARCVPHIRSFWNQGDMSVLET